MSGFEDWIGRERTDEDRLAPGAVAGLLATIDRIGEPQPGDMAPLGAHWLLAPPRVPMSAVGPDGHPVRGDFLPPIPEPRRMWAGSDVTFLAPLRVGSHCRRRSRIAAISRKQGKAGVFWLVELQHETEADGVAAVRERQNLVYLGDRPRADGEPALPGDWPIRRTIVPDPVLLFRYSALTFNGHRIHYDRPYAVEQEGYPALVVHGPLIATLLLDLCRECFGAGRVGRFSFRARAPAFVDQPLHLLARPEGETVALAAVADDRLVTTAHASLRAGE